MSADKNLKITAPLADRMRPRNLGEYLGQDEVVGPKRMLRQAIESGRIPSMIFWGPPGTGKTTLAHIIAKESQAEFLEMSAVNCGVKELKAVVSEARANQIEGRKTIFFLDEIHRWNKKQQDALLPQVESGLITLIGATTENPSFEVVGALLSRCRIIVLQRLAEEDIKKIIENALADEERGLGKLGIKIEKDALLILSQLSNGDGRTALNVLEYASTITKEISLDIIKESFQKSHLLYDKEGEEHYNIISALHKSMRGSDPDAALYWLMRMVEGGEDPLYIARRLVRFAAEDIGLANSRALEQAVAAYQACHFIGLPECNVILAQCVVYMAKCEKSNALYRAVRGAQADVREKGNLPVPLHLRNAPTKLMQDLGYGKDYKYSPDFDYKDKQNYLPEELKGKKYV